MPNRSLKTLRQIISEALRAEPLFRPARPGLRPTLLGSPQRFATEVAALAAAAVVFWLAWMIA